eukprot:10240888-Alexandrium_andersonii.AAC.1
MRRSPGSPAGPLTRIHFHSAPASSRGPSESFSCEVRTASERRMQKGLATPWSSARPLSTAASAVEAT